MLSPDFLHAGLIFLSTFVLEDFAVLGAALLVLNNTVSLPVAAGSSFAGVWLGDLGLYLAALRFGHPILLRPWFRRLTGNLDVTRGERWFQKHGATAVLISRVIPGTRLPTYVAAGLLKQPVARFTAFTAAACAVWVSLLFWLALQLGPGAAAAFTSFGSSFAKLTLVLLLASVVAWVARPSAVRLARRLAQWEFWPPAVFYLPVACKYLRLAIRYRSLSLPCLANPGIRTGGLIGESKFETLADLGREAPEFTAETWLVRFEAEDLQTAAIKRLRVEQHLEFPFVLKPDVGQRGFGFKVVQSEADIAQYVRAFRRDTLVQRYVPGPYEAGILYYRLPGEARGRIFAITDKVFPALTGDGLKTVEQLVHADARASRIARTYLARLGGARHRIPGANEQVRLVEAGNHCQGAIFLDGQRLWSPRLEEHIDRISRSIPGFYAGRYDIRYESEDALRAGLDFRIIELNGVSSEATSIYDPRNTLVSAYRTLFHQLEIIFEIGDQNRRRGLRPSSMGGILKSWNTYRCDAALHPVSD
jgi:membrane protein DedA with SNARE-associated domain